MRLELDKRFCIGCKACEVACMDRYNLMEPLLHIEEKCSFVEGHLVVEHTLQTCLQCKDPHCLKACSQRAISLEEGGVKVRRESCNGCGDCVKACPTFSIHLGERGDGNFAYKCEFCSGEASCVAACPFQALKLSHL